MDILEDVLLDSAETWLSITENKSVDRLFRAHTDVHRHSPQELLKRRESAESRQDPSLPMISKAIVIYTFIYKFIDDLHINSACSEADTAEHKFWNQAHSF